MPVIHLYSPLDMPPPGLLSKLCEGIIDLLALGPGQCWAVWHEVTPHCFSKPGWRYGDLSNAPVVTLYCQPHHSSAEVGAMLRLIGDTLGRGLGCDPDDIFVTVQRLRFAESLLRGSILMNAEQ